MNKISKKSHLRSLTSHKLMQPKTNGPSTTNNAGRKEDLGQLGLSLTSGSPAQSLFKENKFTTID